MEIKNDENLVEAPRDMGKTEETIKKAEESLKETYKTFETTDDSLGNESFNGFKYDNHALEESKLVEVPKFDDLTTAGSNAHTIGELQDKGFFQNPEHPKEELIVEAIDKSKEADDVDEFITAPMHVGQPESVKETSSDRINVEDLMLSLSKDYSLDGLNYPELKKNIIRAFGTIKNIVIDNNDNVEMTKEDWDRFHSNLSKHVELLSKKIEDLKQIDKIKTKELNILKSRLGGKHEDIKDVEDKVGPAEIEIANIRIKIENLNKEWRNIKNIRTQVFAKEKKYNRMFKHVQLMLALCVMLKERFNNKSDLLSEFCSNHDENTKKKLEEYLDLIIKDELLDKHSENDDSLIEELFEFTENSLDEKKEEAEYFKNLAISTMFKIAEMFGWDIPIRPNDDNPEADNLVVSQISKKLANVVNGTAPESNKFNAEDKAKLKDIIMFTDIFIGQGLEKMVESTKTLSDDFKRNILKFRLKQMSILGKAMFKDVDISDDKKNRLMSAIVLSLCKLDTMSIVFYLV